VTAPLLILGVGNPSRGDDALAPALLDALHEAGVDADGEVELLSDFQLQVEHALDLQDRRAVLFVDAAWPGHVAGGVSLAPVALAAAVPASSHALDPAAVLRVCVQLAVPPPPAWLLAIEGQAFELGAPLSVAAQRLLGEALGLARGWLAGQGVAPPA
jgi:hydrogenase maturation protease